MASIFPSLRTDQDRPAHVARHYDGHPMIGPTDIWDTVKKIVGINNPVERRPISPAAPQQADGRPLRKATAGRPLRKPRASLSAGMIRINHGPVGFD
ncbi:MAG: hypothetical protein DI547_11185 [Sphingobium sp.]|jgi:hypothetical protein|nr:MAG: hypothetical protein DI547_11185 [Sphingobium sp.]